MVQSARIPAHGRAVVVGAMCTTVQPNLHVEVGAYVQTIEQWKRSIPDGPQLCRPDGKLGDHAVDPHRTIRDWDLIGTIRPLAPHSLQSADLPYLRADLYTQDV